MKFAAPILASIAAYGTTDAFAPNASVRSKTSLDSYLDDLSPPPPKRGIVSYLDSVGTSSALSGAGISGYLDNINQACDAVRPNAAECAEAISDYAGALSSGDAPAESTGEAAVRIGSYLDALGGTAVPPSGAGMPSFLSTVATAPPRAGGPGIENHLSALGSTSAIRGGASAAAVKSYLDGMSSGASEAPSAPAVKDLIDSVSSGATPTGAGIANYLSSLPVANTQTSGAGIASYLSTVRTNAEVRGAGIGSYLDSINEACEATQPTSACAEAIVDYMDALSSGDVPAESSGPAAQSIGGYLDHLSSGTSAISGPGMPSYLSAMGSASAIQPGSASAVKSYLDAMSAGAAEAPSAPAVAEYLENVSSGAASAPTSGGGIASYLSALTSSSALSGGAGIPTHVGTLASTSQLCGAGVVSYLDTMGGGAFPAPVADVPAVVAGAPAAGSPITTVDTQVSHDGLQTTITITSVTTVIIDDA